MLMGHDVLIWQENKLQNHMILMVDMGEASHPHNTLDVGKQTN